MLANAILPEIAPSMEPLPGGTGKASASAAPARPETTNSVLRAGRNVVGLPNEVPNKNPPRDADSRGQRSNGISPAWLFTESGNTSVASNPNGKRHWQRPYGEPMEGLSSSPMEPPTRGMASTLPTFEAKHASRHRNSPPTSGLLDGEGATNGPPTASASSTQSGFAQVMRAREAAEAEASRQQLVGQKRNITLSDTLSTPRQKREGSKGGSSVTLTPMSAPSSASSRQSSKPRTSTAWQLSPPSTDRQREPSPRTRSVVIAARSGVSSQESADYADDCQVGQTGLTIMSKTGPGPPPRANERANTDTPRVPPRRTQRASTDTPRIPAVEDRDAAVRGSILLGATSMRPLLRTAGPATPASSPRGGSASSPRGAAGVPGASPVLDKLREAVRQVSARKRNEKADPETLQRGGPEYLDFPSKSLHPPPVPAEVLEDDEANNEMRKAFAQAFREKHGSLDHAFKWLDFNNRTALSLASLQASLRLASLPEELRKYKVVTLFKAMDSSRQGIITIQAWRKFFAYDKAEDGGDLKSARILKRVSAVAHRVRDLSKKKKRKPRNDDTVEHQDAQLPGLACIIDSLAGVDEDGDQCSSPTNHAWQAFGYTVEKEAVAIQLEIEINELGLKDLQALAYILIAKCGSLDKAFKWLDYSETGTFSRVQWGTAMLVLHIDIQRLVGLSPQEIFTKMQASGKEGEVTKQQWDKFFKLPPDMPLPKGTHCKYQGDFQKRVQWKLKVILALSANLKARAKEDKAKGNETASNQNLLAVAGTGLSLDRMSRGGSKASTTDTFHSGQRNALKIVHDPPPSPSNIVKVDLASTKDWRGDGFKAKGNAPQGKANAPQDKGNAPQDKKGNHAAANSAAAHAALAAATALLERSSSKHGLGDKHKAGSKEASKAKSKLQMRDAHGLAVDDEEEYSKDRILDLIHDLKADEGARLLHLKRADRREVEEFAKQHGCYLYHDSNTYHILKEGPRAAQIRRVLGELKAGHDHIFPTMNPHLGDFARHLAEGQNMLVTRSPPNPDAAAPRPSPPTSPPPDEDNHVEVFSLGKSIEEFKNGIRDRLKYLSLGEVIDLPATLAADYRQVVLNCVMDLMDSGLRSNNAMGKDVLSVGNLLDFEEAVRSTLGMMPADTKHTFASDDCRRQLHRHIINKVAQEFRYLATEVREDGGATHQFHVDVVRPPSVGGKREPKMTEEELQRIREEVFNLACTGKQGRSMFLRKTDLNAFLRNVFEDSKREGTLEDFFEQVDLAFDDILELQVDMGSRIHHGITLDYFQVFMNKVAGKLGWSTVHFLQQLQIWYSG